MQAITQAIDSRDGVEVGRGETPSVYTEHTQWHQRCLLWLLPRLFLFFMLKGFSRFFVI